MGASLARRRVDDARRTSFYSASRNLNRKVLDFVKRGGLLHEDLKAVPAGEGGVRAGAAVGGWLGCGPAAGAQRRPGAPGGRAGGKLRSGLEEVRATATGGIEALREEQAKALRRLEQRPVRLEARQGALDG